MQVDIKFLVVVITPPPHLSWLPRVWWVDLIVLGTSESSENSHLVSVFLSVDEPLHKMWRTPGVSRYMRRDNRPTILLLNSSNSNSQT